MRAFDQRHVIADLVGVHAIEAVSIDAIANGEAHGWNTLLARGERAVAILDRAELADPQRVHIEITLVVQIGQGVVGYVEAKAKLVDEVLVESVYPLRRKIRHVRRREYRKVRVDGVVVVLGPIHGDTPENAVGGPEIVIDAPEVLVGRDRRFDPFPRREIQGVDLLEVGVRQELVDDVLCARMNTARRKDVVGKRNSGVAVEDNDGRPDDLSGSRVDGRLQQLRKVTGAEDILRKPGRLNAGHHFPAALVIERPEGLVLDQRTADYHSELIPAQLVL